jgi:hypothetical protein
LVDTVGSGAGDNSTRSVETMSKGILALTVMLLAVAIVVAYALNPHILDEYTMDGLSPVFEVGYETPVGFGTVPGQEPFITSVYTIGEGTPFPLSLAGGGGVFAEVVIGDYKSARTNTENPPTNRRFISSLITQPTFIPRGQYAVTVNLYRAECGIIPFSGCSDILVDTATRNLVVGDVVFIS